MATAMTKAMAFRTRKYPQRITPLGCDPAGRTTCEGDGSVISGRTLAPSQTPGRLEAPSGPGYVALARRPKPQAPETRLADLEGHRAFVDSYRAPAEARRHREGGPAPHVRVEDEIAGPGAGQDESLEERLGFLGRIPGSFLRHRGDDTDVPNVSERDAGGGLLRRGGPRPPPVAAPDRARLARAPRRPGPTRAGL